MTTPFLGAKTTFTDAQRYGALLVDARFTVFEGGLPIDKVFYAATSVGSFTIDRNSQQRRVGQITIEVIPDIPPPALVPANPDSLLAPFGAEIFLEAGIAAAGNVLGNGASELDVTWQALGMYVIATTEVSDTGNDMTVTLNLYDRSWTISQRALQAPYNFPATPTGNLVDEMKALINFVWGTNQQGVKLPVAPLQYNFVPTSQMVPVASYDQGSDPWQAVQDMAAACGYELFFDANGIVIGRPIANPATQPVSWNFTDDEDLVTGLGGTGSGALLGSAYSIPIAVNVTMTRDGIYNDIQIQGTGDQNAGTYNGNGIETAGPPALGQAKDTNPNSPTYVNGPMGDVPNFVASSLVSGAGAQAMAANDLRVATSSAWTATITVAPNPLFDVDQIIIVTRPRVGLINARIVLDTITHAIRYADTTQLTGRVLSNESPS